MIDSGSMAEEAPPSNGFGDNPGPFGNPDGSRADIDEVVGEFVDFEGNLAYGALATRPSDAKVRVIVGKPGAGKTVYMRCLQNFQRHQGSVYATAPQQELPNTEVIVRACQLFPPELQAEKWLKLWNRAILRAVVSHLLGNNDLRNHLDADQEQELREEYTAILDPVRRPRWVYGELAQIVHREETRNGLTRYLDHPAWDDLESLIGEILAHSPPIFLYLDAIDEEFDHAPMYWLQAQQGLFEQVMRLLRDDRLGGRLHVVVCIRDIVMSSVLRSERGPKYIGEPHIRYLQWDRRSLVYLLQHKLDNLMPRFFMGDPQQPRTVATWLGHATITNEARGVEERLEDYLLRHIRPIPRDLVSLGNALCLEVVKQKNAGETVVPQEELRLIVRRAARHFGDSQLAQCANQVSSDSMPSGVAMHGSSGLYTGTDGYGDMYTKGIGETLRGLLTNLGVDRFERAQLDELCSQADAAFERSTDLPSVLWQNGLLGYIEPRATGEATVFYSLSEQDTFTIPRAETYVFHPCMIDALGIKSVGKDPVRPF
jgi:hypothetical protein